MPLTPEQYALIRAWIDAKEFIEIVTGPGEKKATARALEWKTDAIGEPVRFQVVVMSPALDFIKEYLRFFQSKDDLEDFCTKAIYDRVRILNGALKEFAETHDLDPSDRLGRFHERTHGSSQDQENEREK